MKLKNLHITLLNVLEMKGELARSLIHRHASAKPGEIAKAIKELEKWKLVKSRQPFVLESGMWPTFVKITKEGREELKQVKEELAKFK